MRHAVGVVDVLVEVEASAHVVDAFGGVNTQGRDS